MSCPAPALQQISRRLSAARTATGLFAEIISANLASGVNRVQVVRTDYVRVRARSAQTLNFNEFAGS